MSEVKKRRLLRLLAEHHKRQCERSLYAFSKEAFKVLHNGKDLKDNWHIRYVTGKLQQVVETIIKGKGQKNLLINIPPRSLKSEMIVYMTAWAWIHSPGLKFISSSYAANLSIRHNVRARRIIESEWYQAQWGDKFEITSDQNTKGEFENTAGGFRFSTSTGGGVTGSGADIVIVDDPINPKGAVSDRKRVEANEFFDQTLRSRLDDPETGVYIVVMQRLHELDLTGHLQQLEPGEWTHICIPAQISTEVRPKTLRGKYKKDLMFPGRFTKQFLRKMAKGLGSYGYSCQYGQRAAPEGGGIIKKKWFGRFGMMALERKAGGNDDQLVWNFKVDTAFTTKEENDATAIMAYMHYKNEMYIREVISVRLEHPELVRFIPEFCHRNGYGSGSRIVIEPKANGLSAAQTLARHTPLNIIVDKAPTVDKVARVKSITAFLEAGRVQLLEHAEWIDYFEHETGTFPNAANDDQVDVLVMAVNDVEDLTGAIIASGII